MKKLLVIGFILASQVTHAGEIICERGQWDSTKTATSLNAKIKNYRSVSAPAIQKDISNDGGGVTVCVTVSDPI